MTQPENMIDRWAQRHDPAPGERTLPARPPTAWLRSSDCI
jgi:hypothetical protein